MKGLSHDHRAIKRLPLSLALLSCLYGSAAMAQAQSEPQQTEDSTQAAPEAVELDRVQVTGTLLKRREYVSTSPMQNIAVQEQASMGRTAITDVLQKTSIAAGQTQITNQFSGFVVEGGTGVQTLSLRGLGANRTLVLLDGQRPGPAGTRGSVGAFDLNVLPTVILQRAEIVKDGASSIYGSDAVAGVVNLITRKNIDRPELNFTMNIPFEGGGDSYNLSGATGWNFDNGSVVVAGEYYRQEALTRGDRDYFRCGQDRVWDGPGGNRIDREDRSILAGTDLAGCNNMLHNRIDDEVTGQLYIPSPDGSTVGPFPGYRPRVNRSYAQAPQAYYEDVLNASWFGSGHIVNQQERKTVYAATDFSFGNVNWSTQLLYNRRETMSHQWRQFFPLIGGSNAEEEAYHYANSPDYVNPMPSGLSVPVLPFPSDQKITVDYYYIANKLSGQFSGTDSWSWESNANFSRSDGDYSALSISASRSGDIEYSDTAPTLNYFDPGYLSGARVDDLASQIGQWHTGNTIYDQTTINAFVTGDLFNLPAGAVSAAFGGEYRRYRIDDQPSELSRTGDLWGQSSADVTRGEDKVKEILGEIEVPLLKGKPGFESLTFNASARWFDYDSVEDSDSVWKVGLNWQINSAFRVRANRGTSFRAPGLYELYLGNQTGFAGQTSVDPCIEWGESTNNILQTNCAALGIPADYLGNSPSALVVSGGGKGVLTPETSTAFTGGLVWTPSFANFSVSLDYFKYEVRDQIGQLSSSDILMGCYAAPISPNAFCDMFNRNPGNATINPYQITEVRNQYININRQLTRGYDLNVNYDRDFSFGKLNIEAQATYTKEDVTQLFDASVESGRSSYDNLGVFGRPKLTANMIASLKRGDWTYYYGLDYVHSTRAMEDFDSSFTYQGRPNAWRQLNADARYYHTASLKYDNDDWSFTFGIKNLLNTEPPKISSGLDGPDNSGARYGVVPAFATQYDYFGRTAFFNAKYKF